MNVSGCDAAESERSDGIAPKILEIHNLKSLSDRHMPVIQRFHADLAGFEPSVRLASLLLKSAAVYFYQNNASWRSDVAAITSSSMRGDLR